MLYNPHQAPLLRPTRTPLPPLWWQVQLESPMQTVAHTQYGIALQQADTHHRAAAELLSKSGALTASADVLVRRVAKHAIVLVLRATDNVSLPSGLRVRVRHTELKVVVAEHVTDESDTEVRCTLLVSDAF